MFAKVQKIVYNDDMRDLIFPELGFTVLDTMIGALADHTEEIFARLDGIQLYGSTYRVRSIEMDPNRNTEKVVLQLMPGADWNDKPVVELDLIGNELIVYQQ